MVQVLQVLTALSKRRMARNTDSYLCYAFILSQLRSNRYTLIDLAHLATMLGKAQPAFPAPSTPATATSAGASAGMGDVRGSSGAAGAAAAAGAWGSGGKKGSATDVAIGETVADLVQELEELACVHMREGSLQPRQLACILWMFGRLGIQPSMPDFRGLICVYIRERVRSPHIPYQY